MIKTAAALCAGVGGLELALAQFGYETTWYCEVDPDASTVLEKRLEGVPNLGDIRDRATWRTAPIPDVLTAGFPCQPISAAGRQRGRADDRYLWPNVRDAITDLMPTTVFLENVQNLISIDTGSVLAEVLGDLYTLGYAARWTVLGACTVGLSHHRHRWFLRAGRVDSGPVPAAVRVLTKCGAPPRRHKLLPTPVARDGDPGQRGEDSVEYWARRRADRPTEGIPLGAVVRLLPTPIATDAQGGPREVPEVRSHRGSDHGPRLRDLAGRLLPTPTAKLGDPRRGSPSREVGARRLAGGRSNLDDAVAADLIDDRFQQYAWAVQRQADATGVLPPEPTEPNKNGQPRLAPRFPEWMMAYPAGWVTDLLDRAPALRCIGNGASPIQTAAAWRLLTPTDPLAHCVFCGRPTGGPLDGCSEPECQAKEIEMEAAFVRSEDR